MLRTMLLAVLLALTCTVAEPADSVIVDSRQTLDQALAGTTAPDSIRRTLALVDVEYYSFDRRLHRGQIVVHRELVNDVRQIFRTVKASRFPVESVIPVRFNRPNNGTSMDTLNNTYGFHYRPKATFKTRQLSAHSYGRAIDINPYQNPALLRNGRIIPAGGDYDLKTPGTLSDTSAVVRLFRRLGWQWGGRWASVKDRMHFEKP
ncbi:M15 family metallopeptidase [uncultured Rikenella sp.]|uniref:M15 family metallopeptidase n=1 Tax=uncultured Rikenella sp. TaxID=368003 RepID=UPI002729DD4F|nr:M15 family metallopeptidase [uncultured Rikenella sp.]